MTRRKLWAKKINGAWQKSLSGILECARLLLAAKDELAHGAFEKMVKDELLFGTSTAQRLMKIGRDKRLTNPAHAQHLPRSWYVLYRLTLLSDREFEERIASGAICSDMERREIDAAEPVKLNVHIPEHRVEHRVLKIVDVPQPPVERRALTVVDYPRDEVLGTTRAGISAEQPTDPDPATASDRAVAMVDLLSDLGELDIDAVVIAAARAVLSEPENADKLSRVRRAISVIRQLQAALGETVFGSPRAPNGYAH
jgi:hypothetical protein